jgi:hypothetical protein
VARPSARLASGHVCGAVAYLPSSLIRA